MHQEVLHSQKIKPTLGATGMRQPPTGMRQTRSLCLTGVQLAKIKSNLFLRNCYVQGRMEMKMKQRARRRGNKWMNLADRLKSRDVELPHQRSRRHLQQPLKANCGA
jgi:hypothetical protein